MANPSSETWQIECRCPQCGAPATMNETDHLLPCTYCRTQLYLIAEDHFRYCIPAPKSMSQDIIYIPYWRLKGLSFSVAGREVTPRFFDANLLALDERDIPPSLGLRPQALKLQFLSQDMQGRFLDPSFSSRQAMERLSQGGLSTLYQAFIGEMVSLIYSPAYQENGMLYDALLHRPVGRLTGEIKEVASKSDCAAAWKIRFVSTLCPQCGWNLEGERDALVLICRNCDSAWTIEQEGTKRVPFVVLAHQRSAAEPCYLPFWRIKARIEGVALRTYADLIRVGNLPKVITAALEETPLYFWSPAFKINPALFLRWARQMTISQPTGKTADAFPPGAFHPVTLPVSEAQEGIVVTIASLINDKRRLFPKLAQIRICLDESVLEYHPFFIRGNELVHETLQFAIEKNALAFGLHL